MFWVIILQYKNLNLPGRATALPAFWRWNARTMASVIDKNRVALVDAVVGTECLEG
jgi:hypothetical protein